MKITVEIDITADDSEGITQALQRIVTLRNVGHFNELTPSKFSDAREYGKGPNTLGTYEWTYVTKPKEKQHE